MAHTDNPLKLHISDIKLSLCFGADDLLTNQLRSFRKVYRLSLNQLPLLDLNGVFLRQRFVELSA